MITPAVDDTHFILNRKKDAIFKKWIQFFFFSFIGLSVLILVIAGPILHIALSDKIVYLLMLTSLILTIALSRYLLAKLYPYQIVVPLNKTSPELEFHVLEGKNTKYFIRNQGHFYDLSSFEEFENALTVFDKKSLKPKSPSTVFLKELRKFEGYHISSFFGINIFISIALFLISILVMVNFNPQIAVLMYIPCSAGFLLSVHYLYQCTVNSIFGFSIKDKVIKAYGFFGVKSFPIEDIFYVDDKTIRNYLLPPIGTYPFAVQVKNRRGQVMFHFLKSSIDLDLEILLFNNGHAFPRE